MLICNDLLSSSFFADVKGIIFDCDGVLFDSWDANKMFYNAVLAQLDLPPMTPEQETYVHAHAVRESYAFIVPPERLAEVGEASRHVDYVNSVLPSLVPEEGLFELLDFLKKTKVLMSICTNRTNTMQMLTDRFGFAKWFSPIISAAMVTPKPNPEGVFVILRKWGLAPQDVAYVGDTQVDELTAKASGVRFWAYKSQGLKAELYIPDFPTMRQALQKCSVAK